MKSALILLCLILTNAQAAMLELKPGQSQVEFLAVGKPSFLKIKGVTDQLSSKLEINEQRLISGTLSVPLNELKTGIELRDEHMKESYLKTKEFPQAILTIKEMPFDFEGEINAKLDLHGTSQDVKVEISKMDLKRKAIFKINIQDFNIPVPNYQGITVAKEVTITTELELINP